MNPWLGMTYTGSLLDRWQWNNGQLVDETFWDAQCKFLHCLSIYTYF